jgi:hypothetical protein
LVPVGTVVADRGYDSEQNHIITENLGIRDTIIRPRYESLQVYKTKGYHRKNMKRHFDWDMYHQRSKAETIFSVIKRMLGEYVMSRYILTQNRETMYRIIAYNCYRITRNYGIILGWFLQSRFHIKNIKKTEDKKYQTIRVDYSNMSFILVNYCTVYRRLSKVAVYIVVDPYVDYVVVDYSNFYWYVVAVCNHCGSRHVFFMKCPDVYCTFIDYCVSI